MQKEILDYCQYYNGEEQCPYNDSYEARAWAAEQQVCSFVKDGAYSFLSYIAAYISKWDPYEYRADVARYVAEFPDCSLNEKMQIARTYELGDYLLVQKPKGRTIFETSWEGTEVQRTGGVYLYFDGRVYEKYGELLPQPSEIYVLRKQDKALATNVKDLLQSRREQIQKFPTKIEYNFITDSAIEHLKFLFKKCSGYAMSFADKARDVMALARDVAKLFRKHDCPIDGLEQNENVVAVIYGPPAFFDYEETGFIIYEIKKYIEHGYPDDYDCMGFGASVDMVKYHLKECKCRPATVTELLAYINEILRTNNEDRRLAPSVAAYLVRQQVISIDDEGAVTYL